MSEPIIVDRSHKPVLVITINRPSRKNAVDRDTAERLWKAFKAFDTDDEMTVAVLTGAGGTFCAGADLKSMSSSASINLIEFEPQANLLSTDMNDCGPMGPTRLLLSKPVIAAVSGFAVAGGLELAAWCDLRVASEDAVFGVFCRTKGVPLIDGGTIRLPRLIGQSAAMDMILTGRPVSAREAKSLNLVNYLVQSKSEVLDQAIKLGKQLAELPQTCMLNDRLSVLISCVGTAADEKYDKHSMHRSTGKGNKGMTAPGVESGAEALKQELAREFELGMKTIRGAGFGKEVRRFVNKDSKL